MKELDISISTSVFPAEIFAVQRIKCDSRAEKRSIGEPNNTSVFQLRYLLWKELSVILVKVITGYKIGIQSLTDN